MIASGGLYDRFLSERFRCLSCFTILFFCLANKLEFFLGDSEVFLFSIKVTVLSQCGLILAIKDCRDTVMVSSNMVPQCDTLFVKLIEKRRSFVCLDFLPLRRLLAQIGNLLREILVDHCIILRYLPVVLI